jgi:dephospho-CoA kinase
MLRIGLTGGMGSGKTTVAKIFEVLGIPVYYADLAARHLMNEDKELRQNIERVFGAEAYANGELNRPFLASQVFKDPDKLKRLNALVHPLTIRDGEQWMNVQSGPFALREAALLFESGADRLLDQVIGVSAPESLRISRVMERDQIGKADVLNRMKNQMDEQAKMNLCHFIILNDEQHAVLPQVLSLHQKLIQLSIK